jgi:hypothetical protein
MNQKKLIITLLKDHLLNTKLINGLEELGFYTDDHRLHVSEVIFELLELDNDKDELFEAYLEWCIQITEKDLFKQPYLLDQYAEKIYEMLVMEKSHG